MTLLPLLTAVSLAVGQAEAAAPDGGRAADTWRDPKSCGPVSVYTLLRLNGKDVALDDVMRLAPPGDRGTSMHQLREAARRLGFRCRVTRPGFEKIRDVSLPAIAHYSGLREGHFVVLLSVRRDTLVVSDMVKCEIKELSFGEFKRLWSGFLLEKDDASRPGPYMALALGVSAGVLLVYWLYRKVTRPPEWTAGGGDPGGGAGGGPP